MRDEAWSLTGTIVKQVLRIGTHLLHLLVVTSGNNLVIVNMRQHVEFGVTLCNRWRR